MPTPFSSKYCIQWLLGDPIPDSAFAEFKPQETAIIHLAHDWNVESDKPLEHDLNVIATRALLDDAKRFKVANFLFMSSPSAHCRALNRYGKIKFHLESLVVDTGYCAIRLGLVYGGRKTGLFGKLLSVCQMPVVPILTPDRLVQPIHINKACEQILHYAVIRRTGVFGVATSEPVNFRCFLDMLAAHYQHRKLLYLPLPIGLILFFCGFSERVPFLPTVSRERVFGLAGTPVIEVHTVANPMNQNSQLANLPYFDPQGVSKRGLLYEGLCLARGVVGYRGSRFRLRAYVRVCLLQPDLCHPIHFSRWPLPVQLTFAAIKRARYREQLTSKLKIITMLYQDILLADYTQNKTRLGRLKCGFGLTLDTMVLIIPIFRHIFFDRKHRQ